jgi:hypothetical protein
LCNGGKKRIRKIAEKLTEEWTQWCLSLKKNRETGGSKQGMEAKKSCSELKQLLM